MLQLIRDWFAQRRNPTREWPPYNGKPLVYDLKAGSLNGVRLGAPLRELQFLGRSRVSLAGDSHDFYNLGIEVELTPDGTVEGYGVHLDPELASLGWAAFTGRVEADLAPVDLTAFTADDCINLLGEPYFCDEDEEEILLYFEFPGREVMVEFADKKNATYLFATTEPAMADEEAREIYGVTRPWPPEEH